MMKKVLCVMISILFFACGEQHPSMQFENGDLLFQSDDKGLGCAIEEVTQGTDRYNFSHVGMVIIDKNRKLTVIEAIDQGVQCTKVDSFLNRGTVTVLARVKPEYRSLLPDATAFAIRQIGCPYDDEYLYDNGKYYCSELIYDAFLTANQGIPFFILEPMTFKSPSTGTFVEAWVEHYQQLNIPIPEGELGCNPNGLSRSDKIEIKGALIKNKNISN